MEVGAKVRHTHVDQAKARRSAAAVPQQLQQSLKLLAVCGYDEEDCIQQAVATMRTGSRPCLALRATHAFTSNHAAPTHYLLTAE